MIALETTRMLDKIRIKINAHYQEKNYDRIKAETRQIVNEELERIKNDPILCKLVITGVGMKMKLYKGRNSQ